MCNENPVEEYVVTNIDLAKMESRIMKWVIDYALEHIEKEHKCDCKKDVPDTTVGVESVPRQLFLCTDNCPAIVPFKDLVESLTSSYPKGHVVAVKTKEALDKFYENLG